jgi:hypothetical protein
MNIEQRILCLAARTRLDIDAEGRLLELLRGPLDWERLWEQGHLHEVLPLISVNLQRLQGQAPLPGEWMARARRRSLATMMRNTALADELMRVTAAFTAVGVEVMPVKGIVLAETLYGSLALRPASDLDILVHPSDLPAARAALYQLGFGHRAEPLFAELHHLYHDLQYFRATDSGEVCLELHWALWAERAYHLATDTLWERAVTTGLHGAQVRVLSPEDTLLHLAIHRSRSALRLRFVCDVAELLRRHSAALDWDYVLRQARVGGARTALFFGLALPQELLGAPLPDDVLARLGVSRLKRRLLEHTCGVSALFRPVAPGDVSQQPSLKLRLLEQDGLGQIVQALGHSIVRTGWKHIHNYRRSHWPAGGKSRL